MTVCTLCQQPAQLLLPPDRTCVQCASRAVEAEADRLARHLAGAPRSDTREHLRHAARVALGLAPGGDLSFAIHTRCALSVNTVVHPVARYVALVERFPGLEASELAALRDELLATEFGYREELRVAFATLVAIALQAAPGGEDA